MKRFFVFVASLLLTLNLFAETSESLIHHHAGLGWRIPTETFVRKNDPKLIKDLDMPFQTGLDFSYLGLIRGNGVSVRVLLDAGYSSSNIDKINSSGKKENSGVDGAFFDFLFGFGWTPVRSDYFLFGFYGMFGFSEANFSHSQKYTFLKKKYEDSFTYTYLTPMAGLNCTFIWSPFGRTFSVYASVTAAYNFPNDMKIETKQVVGGTTTINQKRNYAVDGSFRVLPSVGIGWRF